MSRRPQRQNVLPQHADDHQFSSTLAAEDWKRTSDSDYYIPEECPIDDRYLIDSHPVRITIDVNNDGVLTCKDNYLYNNYQLVPRHHHHNHHRHSLNHNNHHLHPDDHDVTWTAHYQKHQPMTRQQQDEFDRDPIYHSDFYRRNYTGNHNPNSTTTSHQAVSHYMPAFIVNNDFEPDDDFSTWLQQPITPIVPQQQSQAQQSRDVNLRRRVDDVTPQDVHNSSTTKQEKMAKLQQILPLNKRELEQTVEILDSIASPYSNNSNLRDYTPSELHRFSQPQSVLASMFDSGDDSTNPSSNKQSASSSTTLFGFQRPIVQQQPQQQYNVSGKRGFTQNDDFKDDYDPKRSANDNDNSWTRAAMNWIYDTHKTWAQNRDLANGPQSYPTTNLAGFAPGNKSSTDIVSTQVSTQSPAYGSVVEKLIEKQTANPRIRVDKPPHTRSKQFDGQKRPTSSQPFDPSRLEAFGLGFDAHTNTLVPIDEALFEARRHELERDFPAITQSKRPSTTINRNLLQRNYGAKDLSSEVIHNQYLSPFHPSLKGAEFTRGKPQTEYFGTSLAKAPTQQETFDREEIAIQYDNNNVPNTQFFVTGFAYDILPSHHIHNKLDDEDRQQQQYQDQKNDHNMGFGHYDKESHRMEKDNIDNPTETKLPQHKKETTMPGKLPEPVLRPTTRHKLTQAEINLPTYERASPAANEHFEKQYYQEAVMEFGKPKKNESVLNKIFYNGFDVLNKTSHEITSWNARPKQWWNRWWGTETQKEQQDKQDKHEQRPEH